MKQNFQSRWDTLRSPEPEGGSHRTHTAAPAGYLTSIEPPPLSPGEREQEPNSLKAAVQTRHKLPLPICARLAWHSRNLASPIGTDRLPEQMSIYKCTELVHPQAKLRFPYIYRSKEPCPTLGGDKEETSKENKDEKSGETEPQGKVETISEKINSEKNEESLAPENEYEEKFSQSLNHIPKLRYSLGYDHQKRELCVSFLEAVGCPLTKEEDSGSHSYIVGTLTSNGGQTEAQTSLMNRTPHTVWDEALLFPLSEEERVEAELTLTLRHCDRYSRHQVAGEITLSLANLGVPFGAARWVDLRPPEKELEGSGEVLLSLSYLPAASRLIVVVIKARNIHCDQYNNLLGKDLSIKVILKHQSQKLKKKQTKRTKHMINPVWNEMVMFEVPQELLGDVYVELQMVCVKPDRSGNHILGTCNLGAEWTGTGKNHWLEMMNNPRRQIAFWHRLNT
ncbi:synaptotagmin-13 isoform X1 [Xenopus tropicalis]|uniref:Synaptotagmin-13 isoform X1 n=1 Tax=Xenopus tropicalis TaxID=8364 RepID=A0A8J1JH03_XENTR|nr:synaptotagmin-13 isoform X1 [Xenopus tropicalis]XP_031756291.1 synaptotagmin-13 isoform X1 [Xenopus tropicalis]